MSPNRYSLAVIAAAHIAVLLLVLLPRRAIVVLPLALVAALTFASFSAARHGIEAARETKARLVGSNPGWIDSAAHGPVAFLYDGDVYWTAVWENLFFNRRLEHVYDIGPVVVPGPLPQARVDPDGEGRLAIDPHVRYLVTWSSFTVRGTMVARAELTDADQAALVLWRLYGSAQLLTRTMGLLPIGDLPAGETARLTVYACGSGRFTAGVFAKQALSMIVFRDGKPVVRTRLLPKQVWNGTVRSPRGANGRGTCTYELHSTGLLGTTHFAFERSS